MNVSLFLFISGKFPITRLADRSVRLEHLKRAVLKLMIMNNHLYRFLYSNTFDVPEYEKENIAYNSQVRVQYISSFIISHLSCLVNSLLQHL